jgi:hypothetical protein
MVLLVLFMDLLTKNALSLLKISTRNTETNGLKMILKDMLRKLLLQVKLFLAMAMLSLEKLTPDLFVNLTSRMNTLRMMTSSTS